MAAKIKKGDRVVVLTGKDKGRQGNVLKVLPKDERVVVEGLNMVQRHTRPTQFDPQSDYFDPRSPPEAPRWQVVDIAFERRLPRTIRLDELRRHAAALGDFPLLARGNRLSVLPVTQAQWNAILALA